MDYDGVNGNQIASERLEKLYLLRSTDTGHLWDGQLAVNLKVYPNPFRDELNIESEFPVLGLQLMDIQGRVVQQESVRRATQLKWELGPLPAGIYFLGIETTEGRYFTEVIK